MGFNTSKSDHPVTEDFRRLIARIVKEELAKLLGIQQAVSSDTSPTLVAPMCEEKANVSHITNNWLTHSEAATYLKMTSAMLYKLSSLRRIKFSKRGKRNYYKIEHLEQYLADGQIQTQDEIIQQTKLKGKMKII